MQTQQRLHNRQDVFAPPP